MDYITELFYQYRDDVYRLAVSYTHSREDAEDVCQTVFLKAMEHKKLDEGKEKHWLLKVTANECRNLLRSHWWKNTVSLEENIPASEPEIGEILYTIFSLKPKYRVVVYLHYYEMLSTDEIAKLLGISRTAVTTRLSRARQLLKNKLQEE